MLAIIGGTGLTELPGMEIVEARQIDTPYGSPSADLLVGERRGSQVIFLARHGNPHCIPPHKVNYRANLWALKEVGVTQIIAVTAVGGISTKMGPGVLAIPDQIIDYTYGRSHSFFEEHLEHVTHIDFSYPYSESIRQCLIRSAEKLNIAVEPEAIYGCTQGPRLETAAEIRKLARDGCDLVGMTAMPEAALARELELEYAGCSVVANWGAGLQAGEITMAEIEKNLALGMEKMMALLDEAVIQLPG